MQPWTPIWPGWLRMSEPSRSAAAPSTEWQAPGNGRTPRPAVSIVVPTYRRGAVLERNVGRIHDAVCAAIPNDRGFEIILVDDKSPDGTSGAIRRLAERYPEVRGILLAENVGQQNATLAGLRHASGDAVVTMDDDLKDDPDDVPPLLAALSLGLDVVYGVPDCPPEAPRYRRLGTLAKEWLIARLCRKPPGFQLTGFRAMNRPTVDRICRETRRWVYISATILQEPVRAGQLPVSGYRGPVPASGHTLIRLVRTIACLAVQYGRHPLLRFARAPGLQYEIRETVGWPMKTSC